MLGAEFGQFIQENGSVSVPCWLLEKYQTLDIAPEELGYLLLAIYQQQRKASEAKSGAAEKPYQDKLSPGDNPWIGKALEKGWAAWTGEGDDRKAVFDPLWKQLYRLWEEEQDLRKRTNAPQIAGAVDFDYSRIVKELDRIRGNLSVTIREQQLIQEFNIKYGWSTDFILQFFRLCSNRNLMQMKNYRPMAAQIFRSGVYTLEGLEAFMNEVDWIGKQVAEIKKDYLGLYGMVTVTERDFYVKWHITWRFNHGIIVRAASESAGASNASFRYLDTILTRWHEMGVDTLEACEEAIRVWREEQKKRSRTGSGARAQGRTGGRKTQKERGVSPWSGFASMESAGEGDADTE